MCVRERASEQARESERGGREELSPLQTHTLCHSSAARLRSLTSQQRRAGTHRRSSDLGPAGAPWCPDLQEPSEEEEEEEEEENAEE